MLAFFVYAFILLGLATLQGELMILALPLLAYLAAGYLFRPQNQTLELTRQFNHNRVSPNYPVEVTLTIQNTGETVVEHLYLQDQIPHGLTLIEGDTNVLTHLQPGDAVQVQYTVQGARGHYQFGAVRGYARDALGLFRQDQGYFVPGQLFILPEVINLRRAEIRPRRTRVYAGQIPTNQGGPGVEFYGLREYQPGDERRWINARASARYTQRLFVNQFEQDRAADIGLILDVRQQSNIQIGEHSLFEYNALATAALADTLLNQGNRVGLLIYGDALDWTYPRYGKYQRESILQALAQAHVSDRPIFADLKYIPARLFPIRSQLIIISALAPDDLDALMQLRQRQYSIIIISPDPISFEAQHLPDDETLALAQRLARIEREVMVRKLRQAGIRVVEWDVQKPFQQIAHEALERLVRIP